MSIGAHLTRAYAAVALAALPLAAWLAASPDSREFEEITVQRINVVEPDGSVKLVISNSDRMPMGTIGGEPLPDRERPPGILFFDDRGDEAGGVGVFGDSTTRYGGLAIDQIGNDESVRLVSRQGYQGDQFAHQAGLFIRDMDPALTLPDLVARMEEVRAVADPTERRERVEALQEDGVLPADRLFVGRRADGGVVVDMRDDRGAPRLRLIVEPAGQARIEFLDDDGTVIRSIGPTGRAGRL